MYDYQKEKPYTFTDDGQRDLFKLRDFAKGKVGAFNSKYITGEDLLGMPNWNACETWKMMACIDRLVELGHLQVLQGYEALTWQGKIYTAGMLL